MSFKVYNASAGSGKTYTLTKEYLKILFQAPTQDKYRRILAITFTNKAGLCVLFKSDLKTIDSSMPFGALGITLIFTCLLSLSILARLKVFILFSFALLLSGITESQWSFPHNRAESAIDG